MLFRRDDSQPLDLMEDEEWAEMESIGRRRYVVNRTVLALNLTFLPVVALAWSAWWVAPQSRPFFLDRFVWIPLAVGFVVVGSLTAVHARDTWNSYEKRAQLDDTSSPRETIARLHRRAGRFGLRSAVFMSVAAGLEIVAHAPGWTIAVVGAAALIAWRSVYVNWSTGKVLLGKTQEPYK